MKSDNASLEAASVAFNSSLSSHFRDLAAKADLKVDAARLSAIWEQGLLVAGCGAYPRTAKEGHDVGLIHVSTPKNLPLRTPTDADLPPGSYVIQLGKDGSVSLNEVGGGISVPFARPGTAKLQTGGSLPPCHGAGGYSVRLDYKGCKVCISVFCEGQWAIFLGCFEIPFCQLATGLFDILR